MRVSIRIQKRLLLFATSACFAAAGAVIAIQLRPPTVGASRAAKFAPNSLPGAMAVASSEPSREDFERLCELPLRRALYDPPPPTPEVKQAPPLRIELLGTILEADNSLAMLKAENGSVAYKRVGEAVGPSESPAEIVEIRSDAVILKRAEERITLQVQAKEFR